MEDLYLEYTKNSNKSINETHYPVRKTFYERKYMNGLQSHEKEFNILSHSGNAN